MISKRSIHSFDITFARLRHLIVNEQDIATAPWSAEGLRGIVSGS